MVDPDAPLFDESTPNDGELTTPPDTPGGPTGRFLVGGEARGRLLILTHPISFWGGVDPVAGRIVDPRHPQFDAEIRGRVLVIPSAVGSSSSSAIMLELLREKTAPAAILMGVPDAILALGAVVGRELGYPTIPILAVSRRVIDGLEDGAEVRVTADGEIVSV